MVLGDHTLSASRHVWRRVRRGAHIVTKRDGDWGEGQKHFKTSLLRFYKHIYYRFADGVEDDSSKLNTHLTDIISDQHMNI